MNATAYLMGGYGVDVKLNQRPGPFYPCNTEGGRVFWGCKNHNIPSYVIADARPSLEGMDRYERSPYWYHSETDTYVRLISVNGLGEIRWSVDPSYPWGTGWEDAARYFGLID